MIVHKPTHKVLLVGCFYEETPTTKSQKVFPLEVMTDAWSAYRKLIEGMDEKSGELPDSPIELEGKELDIVRQLFLEKGKRGFEIGKGQVVLEVKKLLKV